MDYVKPADVVSGMVEAGSSKGRLSVGQLLLRGALAGAFLGVATSLAVTASAQTGLPIVGALIFPVKNWFWVFIGNLIGGVLYAGLLAIALTNAGATPPNAIGKALIRLAETKTVGYAGYGGQGMLTAFVKGVLYRRTEHKAAVQAPSPVVAYDTQS